MMRRESCQEGDDQSDFSAKIIAVNNELKEYDAKLDGDLTFSKESSGKLSDDDIGE